MIFAFGSARGCPTHQLGDCLVCGAEMISQGSSWRFRNKDTYYTQERRADMTINFKIEYDGLSDEAQNVAPVCGSGLDPVSVYDLSDEALGPPPPLVPVCMTCR